MEQDDAVFRALADPTRRRLLDSLRAADGLTLRELCAGLDMARQSVSKHLAVLEAANLVATRRRGREKLHHLNAAPLDAITERWIDRYHRGRVRVLADLKTALEAPMTTTDTAFVYTTYIRTTPERLWQALTDPAFTSRYWGATFDTDWQPGSTMRWSLGGWSHADEGQVVVRAEPYTVLSFTWHTIDADFAAEVELPADDLPRWAADPRSTVTFELEQQGEVVKLTVVHDGFAPGSPVLDGIQGGWPSIISGLKSLLETGEELHIPQ
ncbi:ArsR/SmtB family transcription factor [Nocardia jiangsuensis]|uniref:ArsR/SmtB family transcription factor n=1 Tax=Nocardia jiangsuensis TaxID=1691563 RepID=A0ABV8DU19_9NOCA